MRCNLALPCLLALAIPASAEPAARTQVVIAAPAARQAEALLLLRIAVPEGRETRSRGVEELRAMARGYVASRRGIVLAGTPDIAAGEVEPSREELQRAARRQGAREVVIVSVDDYRGCGSFTLPVPVLSTYGRAALRLERYDAASGRPLHRAAVIRHTGGAFARLDAEDRTALLAATVDGLWRGAVADDAEARAGFERTCAR